MRVTTREINDKEIVGKAVELWDDGCKAEVKVYALGAKTITFTGTPRELRTFARQMSEMLRTPREIGRKRNLR